MALENFVIKTNKVKGISDFSWSAIFVLKTKEFDEKV
jgi:hypothetical protein